MLISIITIELFCLLCLYAMPLGAGSVNSPCIGLSVHCQAPRYCVYGNNTV